MSDASEALARLRALNEARTKGPWSVCYYDAGDKDEWDQCPSIQAPESEDCAVVHWAGFKQRYWQSAHGDQRAIDANAAAIVAALNALGPLLDAAEALEKLSEAAGCIRHWHDAMKDGSGMVVSAEHVRKLWDETNKARAALDAIAMLEWK